MATDRLINSTQGDSIITKLDDIKTAINNQSAAATEAPLMDGAATVGTSTKYARENHVHPTDTSRAANVMSTYAVDTTRENITTSSTVQGAIEQLEYREELNKNNILSLYNQNGKTFNVIDWTNFGGNSDVGIKYSYADDTITVVGSKLASDSYLSIAGVSSVIKTNTWYALVCVTTGSPRISARIFGYNGSTYAQLSDSASLAYFNSGNYQSYICRIVVAGSTGDSVNATIKPMLIEKSIYDAGFTDYQPYALPNAAITPALKECVDSGAKNRLPATSTTTSTSNGLTLVVNSDYSITITGTMTTVENTDIYFIGSWTNTSPFANYTGKNMRMYCKSSASIVGQFKMYDRTANKGYAVAINNNEGTNISGNLTAAYFTIGATANAINVTLYPMICEPSSYIVSQQYIPPAMSNAELTAKEQVNENNILSLTANTVAKGNRYVANQVKTYTLEGSYTYLITVISYNVAGMFLALKYNNETSPRLFPVYKAANFDNSLTVASVADSSDISITPTSSNIWFISNIATL